MPWPDILTRAGCLLDQVSRALLRQLCQAEQDGQDLCGEGAKGNGQFAVKKVALTCFQVFMHQDLASHKPSFKN